MRREREVRKTTGNSALDGSAAAKKIPGCSIKYDE